MDLRTGAASLMLCCAWIPAEPAHAQDPSAMPEDFYEAEAGKCKTAPVDAECCMNTVLRARDDGWRPVVYPKVPAGQRKLPACPAGFKVYQPPCKFYSVWCVPEERAAGVRDPKPAPPLEGEVLAVLEGHLLRVRHGERMVLVRLYGVECPGGKQAYAAQARRFVSKMTRGRRVRVLPLGDSPEGGIIGEVYVGEASLNRELLREGWAWWLRVQASENVELEKLQAAARQARRGLWAKDPPKAAF